MNQNHPEEMTMLVQDNNPPQVRPQSRPPLFLGSDFIPPPPFFGAEQIEAIYIDFSKVNLLTDEKLEIAREAVQLIITGDIVAADVKLDELYRSDRNAVVATCRRHGMELLFF